MAARLVILGGLLALIAGVAVAGSQTAHRQLSSNLIDGNQFVLVLKAGDELCQTGENVPSTTSALRFTIGTYGRSGPPLEVRIGRASQGRLEGGWREGSVVVPTSDLDRQLTATRVCVRNAGNARIALAGAPFDRGIGARVEGDRVPARIRIEYTTARERSWWGLAGTIADRIGDVRVGFPGAATAWMWAGLLGILIAGVVGILIRRPRGGGPIALLALISALAWGLVVPPFQVPDEQAHYYYASYLAQTGELPGQSSFWFSQRMNTVLTTMSFSQVIGRPENRPPWTDGARAAIEQQERADIDDRGVGDAASATTNPPGYYLLQAIPYALSPSSDLTDRLAFMRILSAIISALTVLAIYVFLRELLPGSPWSATVGALVAALQPMFGFISSGVNNDGLLYLFSALLLLAIARAFRRGLTPWRAATIGAVLGVGTLVKTQLIAFAPAVVLALLQLLVRDRDRERRVPWRSLLYGAGATALPLLLYFVLGQTVWERPLVDRVGEVTGSSASPTATGMVSYVWQSYLPRLPFLDDWFPGFALKSLWIDGLIGRFGWLDFTFPTWVLTIGAVALTLVATAAVATLIRHRDVVSARAGEAVVYLAVVAGLAVAVAVTGYVQRLSSGQPFEQARYLLPLLPLYAAAVALATQALGRRWMHRLGAIVVLAALAHTVFAQLLTITRYYG